MGNKTLDYQTHRYSHDKSLDIKTERFSDDEFKSIVKEFKRGSKEIQKTFSKLRPTQEDMSVVYGAITPNNR